MILPMLLETSSASEVTTWNGIGLGSLIMIALFVFSAVGFFFAIKKNRREDAEAADKAAKKITDNIDKISTALEPRLVKLEDKTADFLRKSEICNMIDHEKANRLDSDKALKMLADKNADDIVNLRILVGQVQQKHQGLEDDVHEIKDLMKDHRRENNEKLDKITASIVALSQKP